MQDLRAEPAPYEMQGKSASRKALNAETRNPVVNVAAVPAPGAGKQRRYIHKKGYWECIKPAEARYFDSKIDSTTATEYN